MEVGEKNEPEDELDEFKVDGKVELKKNDGKKSRRWGANVH